MPSAHEDRSILSSAIPAPANFWRYGELDDQVIEVWHPIDAPRGVIFLLHGGFWQHEFDRVHLRPMAQALSADGFTVLLPEFRRVGGGGGWPATFDDVFAASLALNDELCADLPAIFVGHSAGGHLALWLAATSYRPRLVGVVPLAPVADLHRAHELGLGDGAVEQLLAGTPTDYPDRYAAADPALLPTPGAPVRIVHGAWDSIVPSTISTAYAEGRDGVSVELLDVGHFELIDPQNNAFSSVSQTIEAIMTEHQTNTRNALHSVAEWLLAGPQYKQTGTIRLSVANASIATQDGGTSLDKDGLTVALDDNVRQIPWGSTVAEMGEAAKITPTVPQELYDDHAPLGVDDTLVVDPSVVESHINWFEQGRDAMLDFHPAEIPVLWPEHFDLGITVDEVNYGISLGDGYHQLPYAYVGPWRVPEGPFWNAPFGAVRGQSELPDAAAIAAFFATAAKQARS